MMPLTIRPTASSRQKTACRRLARDGKHFVEFGRQIEHDQILVAGLKLRIRFHGPITSSVSPTSSLFIREAALRAVRPRRRPITVSPYRLRKSASPRTVPTRSEDRRHDHLGHADFLRQVAEVSAAERQLPRARFLFANSSMLAPSENRSMCRISPALISVFAFGRSRSLEIAASLDGDDVRPGPCRAAAIPPSLLPTSGERSSRELDVHGPPADTPRPSRESSADRSLSSRFGSAASQRRAKIM